MPRAVLFDFGGVIWNMRHDVSQALEREHGLPAGSVFETLYRTETWRRLERGEGDREAWLAEAHAHLERRAGRPLPRLHEAWRASQAPIHANVALIRTLRPSFRLGVLSNADRTLRARLDAQVGIVACFEDIVCSAEVGVAKPAPEIYRLACARLALPPAACVFVDDLEANVRAAEAEGLRAVHYRVDRGDDLRAQLARLGVVAAAAREE